MDVLVTALSDYPEFIPVVARWHWQEWGHAEPDGTLGSWTAALTRQAGADQIPGTLIAVVAGVPAGVVCLVDSDMAGYEAAAAMSPWVKGLYVDEPARRRGYGALLMARCEAWAAELGYQALHLYTERGSGAEQLYQRVGWQIIRHDQYNRMDVSVMRKDLAGGSGQSHRVTPAPTDRTRWRATGT
jgi:GNAT superfamily N-acetyltransferase